LSAVSTASEPELQKNMVERGVGGDAARELERLGVRELKGRR
jgi:hypothetical protein